MSSHGPAPTFHQLNLNVTVVEPAIGGQSSTRRLGANLARGARWGGRWPSAAGPTLAGAGAMDSAWLGVGLVQLLPQRADFLGWLGKLATEAKQTKSDWNEHARFPLWVLGAFANQPLAAAGMENPARSVIWLLLELLASGCKPQERRSCPRAGRARCHLGQGRKDPAPRKAVTKVAEPYPPKLAAALVDGLAGIGGGLAICA